jgi:hypothetical protein
MLVSEKQQAANRQNAQHSTGPKTPEGKAAVRFNALTWTLRARSLMIHNEDPEEYQLLWNSLEAEWHPQTQTERYYLEQMATSHWLLARNAATERRVHTAPLDLAEELALLDRVSGQRTRLERSFTSAMRELKQLQKDRQARSPQPQPVETKQTEAAPAPAHNSTGTPARPPNDVMSPGPEAPAVSCSPITPDTR